MFTTFSTVFIFLPFYIFISIEQGQTSHTNDLKEDNFTLLQDISGKKNNNTYKVQRLKDRLFLIGNELSNITEDTVVDMNFSKAFDILEELKDLSSIHNKTDYLVFQLFQECAKQKKWPKPLRSECFKESLEIGKENKSFLQHNPALSRLAKEFATI